MPTSVSAPPCAGSIFVTVPENACPGTASTVKTAVSPTEIRPLCAALIVASTCANRERRRTAASWFLPKPCDPARHCAPGSFPRSERRCASRRAGSWPPPERPERAGTLLSSVGRPAPGKRSTDLRNRVEPLAARAGRFLALPEPRAPHQVFFDLFRAEPRSRAARQLSYRLPPGWGCASISAQT